MVKSKIDSERYAEAIVELKEPTFDNFMDLCMFFEKSFGRKIDLVTPDGLSPYLRPYIFKEVRWHEA